MKQIFSMFKCWCRILRFWLQITVVMTWYRQSFEALFILIGPLRLHGSRLTPHWLHSTTLIPDETFRIHRNPNKRNRVIDDTIVEVPSSKQKNSTKSTEAIFKKPKFRRCNFIDDECDVSDGSSDEFDASSDTELNSIICNEDVHDDTSVDMRAIYLQSVKYVNIKHYCGLLTNVVVPFIFL